MDDLLPKGDHFEVSEEGFTIFNANGYVENETTWRVGSASGLRIKGEPKPVLSEIEAVIEGDRLAGNEPYIAKVQISATVALRLWLEGVLTNQMLLLARSRESSVVTIVPLGGKDRVVSIISDKDAEKFGHTIATLDDQGALIVNE